MKVKRILPVVVSLIMAGGVLAGCAHTHTYEEKWTPAEDGSGHYHVATCHPEEHDELKDHVYDDDKDTTCNDCGYVRTVEQGTPDPTPDPDPKPSGDTSTPLPADKKIYLVGDSTVCDYSAKLDYFYLPRYGYGTQLHEYLNVQESQIVNKAISGRSSKSFLTETNYTEVKNSIAEGDYLIIGFGHNDEKNDDAARFTDPAGTYTQATTSKGASFQYVLYENYVKMATDKGATAILCTPIVRYDSEGSYTGAKAHNTSDGDYAAAIKSLGEATNTPVVDLTEITKTLYKSDNDAAKYFHACTMYKGDETNKQLGKIDETHLNKYGAKMVAYKFAEALKSTDCGLKAHVIANKAAPTYATDFDDAVRADYVNADYTQFNPADHTEIGSTMITTPTSTEERKWFGTALGDITSETSATADWEHSCNEGVFTVGNNTSNLRGKFAGAQDGFGAAFMQIEADMNFTASATVKVKKMSSSANNQSGFGMMLRDDIYVNKYLPSLSTNYIAAGVLLNEKVETKSDFQP